MPNTKAIMEIVDRICSMESSNCRSLNKRNDARLLMDHANIPSTAIITEIPLDWDKQVEILFTMPEDITHKVNYYFSLFAGIGMNGKFCFNLYKVGEWKPNSCEVDFYVRDKSIPMDYFINHQ